MVTSDLHTARAAGRVLCRFGEAVTVLAGLTLTFLALIVLAGPASAAPDLYAAVCPEAPPGTQAFADDVTAWVKWGVLVLIGIAGVTSIGAIVGGRIFNHPHASRQGATGIAWTVAAAILYGVVLVIIDSIVGSGCT